MKAIHMLQDDRRNKKLPERSVDMIILLTDGVPNSGGCTEISKYICDDSFDVICHMSHMWSLFMDMLTSCSITLGHD